MAPRAYFSFEHPIGEARRAEGQARSAAGDPRSHRPQAPPGRTGQRLGDRPEHPGHLERGARRQLRQHLSRASPPRGGRLRHRALGDDRQQPPRALLHPHCGRPKASGRRARRLGEIHGRARSHPGVRMMRLQGLTVRLRALLGRRAAEADLDEELQYHLEKEIERLRALGWEPEAARLEAKRLFGNAPLYKEEVRDAWGARWIEALGQDIRVSLRGFRRAPGFAATVIATIALGLALNTTAFTIFDSYILKPLPIRDPTTLYDTGWRERNGRIDVRIGWREFLALSRSPVVPQSFAYRSEERRGEKEPLLGLAVSGNAFQVLGATAAIGRLFGAAEATPPAGLPVMVLSHAAWKAKFGGDSTIVGKRILVNGMPLTVIGVAAEKFTGIGPVPPDYWAPITLLARLRNEPDFFGPDDPPVVHAIVRVKDGISARAARAALA